MPLIRNNYWRQRNGCSLHWRFPSPGRCCRFPSFRLPLHFIFLLVGDKIASTIFTRSRRTAIASSTSETLTTLSPTGTWPWWPGYNPSVTSSGTGLRPRAPDDLCLMYRKSFKFKICAFRVFYSTANNLVRSPCPYQTTL